MLHSFEHDGRVLELFAYSPRLGEAGPRPSRAPAGAAVQPAGGPELRAPGAGRIEIGGLAAAEERGATTLTATVAGKNIAYIYTEILLRDPSADRCYGPLIREHIRATQEREVKGLTHPVWDSSVDLVVKIRPVMCLLTDGTAWALCGAVREGYGSPNLRVAGLYTPAGHLPSNDAPAGDPPVAAGGPFRANLTFAGAGDLKRVIPQGRPGARRRARTLTPQMGDSFSPLVDVLTPPGKDDEAGPPARNRHDAGAWDAWQTSTSLATTLTLRDGRLRMNEEAIKPGRYLVGIVVQDLDGALTRRYVAPSLRDGTPGDHLRPNRLSPDV